MPAEQKETEEQKSEQQEQWDKTKQANDQLKANLDKALADKTALAEQVADYETRITTLEQRVEKSQQKVDNVKELDPYDTELPDLVKQAGKDRAELKSVKDKLVVLEKLASDFQAKEQQRERDARKSATIEKILKPLDEEFGAKYRNDAKKMADELVNSGKKKVEDSLDAAILMRECYKKLASEDKTKQKTKTEKDETVTADSGIGGIAFSEDLIKEGTLEEVYADMAKKIKI